MTRDPLYGEPILWEGAPRELPRSPLLELCSHLGSLVALIAMAFAVVRGVWLDGNLTSPLLFAALAATLGATCHLGPIVWYRAVRYLITDQHVIMTRGIFRRAIIRSHVSFARIRWSPENEAIGSLELVRAVPTGAMFRCLTLELVGIEHPAAVWGIIRDAHDVTNPGHSGLPLTQRLDSDERVLWAARPLPSFRAYLPVRPADWMVVGLILALLGTVTFLVVRGATLLTRLLGSGLEAGSLPFFSLGLGYMLGVVVVLLITAHLVYHGFTLRAVGLHQTRYLISNKRVLIQRGREELHLDRRRIVDVIETSAGAGTYNLFLVLDGPRARALAAHGAFGTEEPSSALRPILECVQDPRGAVDVLARRVSVSPPRAA